MPGLVENEAETTVMVVFIEAVPGRVENKAETTAMVVFIEVVRLFVFLSLSLSLSLSQRHTLSQNLESLQAKSTTLLSSQALLLLRLSLRGTEIALQLTILSDQNIS